MADYLTQGQLAQLTQIRRWFYITLAVAVACVAFVIVQPESLWSILALAAIIPIAMYLNSFKCPRCENRFFRGQGASLISRLRILRSRAAARQSRGSKVSHPRFSKRMWYVDDFQMNKICSPFRAKPLAWLPLRTHFAYGDAFALTLMALMLNLFRIDKASIVLDEATSVRFVRLNFISLIPVVAGGDPNMSLYYILLNLWVRIFGESETAVRSLSAIFGALAVWAIYVLGARLFGRITGIVAGLMLALNTFMMQYAQLARSYALLVVLVTLSSYLFVIEVEQPSRRSRLAYVLASAASVYSHYFAAYVGIAQFATALMLRPCVPRRREWITTGTVILLLCAPEALFAYRGGVEGISWIEPSSLSSIGSTLLAFADGSGFLLVLLLIAVVVAFAVSERRFWPRGFLAAWLVIPIALTYLISFVVPMFVSNYLLICLPALILLSASGMTGLPQPILRAAFVAVLVGLSIPQLKNFYTHERGENWRDATRFVLAASRARDAIVFYPVWAHKPFDYYQRKNNAAAPATRTGLASVQQPRVWLMIRESDAEAHPTEIQRLRSSLLHDYRLVGQKEFRRVGVELYAR